MIGEKAICERKREKKTALKVLKHAKKMKQLKFLFPETFTYKDIPYDQDDEI